jgi:hypothetical protein
VNPFITAGSTSNVEEADRRLTITLDKAVLDRIRSGRLTLSEAIQAGSIQRSGGQPADLARFFGYFEVPFGAPIRSWYAEEGQCVLCGPDVLA